MHLRLRSKLSVKKNFEINKGWIICIFSFFEYKNAKKCKGYGQLINSLYKNLIS